LTSHDVSDEATASPELVASGSARRDLPSRAPPGIAGTMLVGSHGVTVHPFPLAVHEEPPPVVDPHEQLLTH
jgi:hypothetical protein